MTCKELPAASDQTGSPGDNVSLLYGELLSQDGTVNGSAVLTYDIASSSIAHHFFFLIGTSLLSLTVPILTGQADIGCWSDQEPWRGK